MRLRGTTSRRRRRELRVRAFPQRSSNQGLVNASKRTQPCTSSTSLLFIDANSKCCENPLHFHDRKPSTEGVVEKNNAALHGVDNSDRASSHHQRSNEGNRRRRGREALAERAIPVVGHREHGEVRGDLGDVHARRGVVYRSYSELGGAHVRRCQGDGLMHALVSATWLPARGSGMGRFSAMSVVNMHCSQV